jgi:ferredoxin-NADP reductase
VEIVGIIICSLVVLQLALLLVATARRAVQEGRQRALSLQLLKRRVEAARALCVERDQIKLSWEGYRKFVIDRKVDEGGNICSFYLVPHDRRPLPTFQPGQYLTFQVNMPGQPKPLVRCYSLSDHANPNYYRVTIKRAPIAKDGSGNPIPSVSNFFHDRLGEGDILDVKAPRGKFVLDLERETPIVLIGGGVGITPFLCMVNTLTAMGSKRETWLFYGVRHGGEHIMKEHFKSLVQAGDNIKPRICYSGAAATDVLERDYHFGQHVSVELLRKVLPSSNYEFYVCGPPPMMASITRDLKDWGVPEERILTEAFGPATVKKAFVPGADQGKPAEAASAVAGGVQVCFGKSAKECAWDPQTGNLLDFAATHGISIASGCRAGNCGTCEVALKAGEVRYVHEPGWAVQPGTCLTCVAVPKKGPVVLDA